jgi:hypothetical protein
MKTALTEILNRATILKAHIAGLRVSLITAEEKLTGLTKEATRAIEAELSLTASKASKPTRKARADRGQLCKLCDGTASTGHRVECPAIMGGRDHAREASERAGLIDVAYLTKTDGELVLGADGGMTQLCSCEHDYTIRTEHGRTICNHCDRTLPATR